MSGKAGQTADDDIDSVKTTETSLNMVEYLHKSGGADLVTVADKLGVAMSTAHRHLSTLLEREYVTKEAGVYRPSLRFLDIGERARAKHSGYELAERKIQKLAEETDERVQFIKEEHNQAVYVYKAAGEDAVETDTHIGKHVPLHASAAGLAILASKPEHAVQEVINDQGLSQETRHTITDPDVLFEELQKIQQRGYSINDQGFIEGLRAVGVPVTDSDGELIGAISVSGPTNRMQGDWFETTLPNLLLGAANELELKLAYR